MPKMIIIRGASGSGKSTLAKLMSNYLRCNYHEADQYMYEGGMYKFDPNKLPYVHGRCQQAVTEDVEQKKDVVVSNTATTLKEFQFYLDLADKHNYDVQIIHTQANYENLHGVGKEKVEQMRKRFQPYDLRSKES